MGYRVDLDHTHSRAIVREIGRVAETEPELPERLRKQIDRLRELEEQSPLIIPAAERWDKVRR